MSGDLINEFQVDLLKFRGETLKNSQALSLLIELIHPSTDVTA